MVKSKGNCHPYSIAFLMLLLWVSDIDETAARGIFISKTKRQIFREEVLPSLGGKIPQGALALERLQHNTYDTVGIFVPDGGIYEFRNYDIRPGHSDPEDAQEVIMVPPKSQEGVVDPYGAIPVKPHKTTYLIRKPFKFGYNAPTLHRIPDNRFFGINLLPGLNKYLGGIGNPKFTIPNTILLI